MKTLRVISILVFLTLCFTYSNGLIHNLRIHEDTRGSFFIENFGFAPGGQLFLNLTDFETKTGSTIPQNHQFGLIIKRTQTNYQRFLQDHPDSECLLDEKLELGEEKIMIDNWAETSKNLIIGPESGGFYNIYFVSCEKVKEPISFNVNIYFKIIYNIKRTNYQILNLVMFNEGPAYLSVGDAPLPIVYAAFTVLYFLFITYWIWAYLIPGTGKTVFKIHYLMTIAALFKLGSVFFHAVELYFLNQVGHPGGWTWVYLAFSLLKGVSFFVVIALIGTGWAFIKPFLTERDRTVFVIVIPLQIISNIALIYVEETSPGTQSWFTLYDVFRLVDIICCIAILVPIIGSIKHLREAAQVDGKAARNVEKLKLFREFYMLVISYIYFTRIIVFLLDSTMQYSVVWLSTFVSELCTLSFFVATGYYFRPVANNPYLKVDEDDIFEASSDIGDEQL